LEQRGLIAAIFERNSFPERSKISRRWMQSSARAKKDPKLEEILEAFIRPTVRSSIASQKDRESITKLLDAVSPNEARKSKRFLKRQFELLVERMDAALMKALPHLSRSGTFSLVHLKIHLWSIASLAADKDRFLPAWLESKIEVEGKSKTNLFFGCRIPGLPDSRLNIYEVIISRRCPGSHYRTGSALRHIDQALKDTFLHFYTTTRFAQRMREKGFKHHQCPRLKMSVVMAASERGESYDRASGANQSMREAPKCARVRPGYSAEAVVRRGIGRQRRPGAFPDRSNAIGSLS